MQETEHYNLKKPEDADFVRVSDLNSNADAIDAKLHELATEVTPIARGGTGKTNADDARTALGAASQADLDTLRDSVSHVVTAEDSSVRLVRFLYGEPDAVPSKTANQIMVVYNKNSKTLSADVRVDGVWLGPKPLAQW